MKESTDISFGNLQVDQDRTVEGTGNADLKQTITGKPEAGTGYSVENDIQFNGTIDAKTYTAATGDAELHLEGEKGDNKAGHYASVERGTLNSKSGFWVRSNSK